MLDVWEIWEKTARTYRTLYLQSLHVLVPVPRRDEIDSILQDCANACTVLALIWHDAGTHGLFRRRARRKTAKEQNA